MFGTTVGGWLLAKSAIKAQELLDENTENEDFLNAKIETAKFFSQQLLPQVNGLLSSTTSGSSSLYAIDHETLRR